MFIRSCCFPILALCPSLAFAQSDGSAEPPPSDTIVVTGRGLGETPAAPAYDTQTITREELVSEPSGRVENALALVAGVQQFRRSDSRSANPSAQGVTLRALGGNATTRALVLLDGVPMTDPFFGYVPFNAIAPERLGEIRVTRGGGSGPFGAGALSGTIELDSASPDLHPTFEARGLIDNRAETEASATASTKLGTGYAVVSGRWDRGRGFFTTPVDQRVPASARASFDDWSLHARGVVPVAPDIELQARMLLYRDERELRFEGARSLSEAQDASVRLVGRGVWEFDAIAYLQQRNFANIVISSTRFTPVLDQRKTPSTGLGGKFELRPPIGGHHVLRVGADYRRSDGELFEDAISALSGLVTERRNAGGTNTDFGLFAEDDWMLGDLTLTAGARADRYTIRGGFFRTRSPDGVVLDDIVYPARSGWETSFRGGALYRAGPHISLRAAAYSGLRLPTLNELYRPFVVFPVVTQANADLRNETLKGAEIGADYDTGSVRVSVTGFVNRLDDAIANVTIGENLRQRRNIDAIVARGIEASGGLQFGALSFDSSLALTDAEARGPGLDGNRPSQTPRFVATARAAWQAGERSLIAVTVQHVGAQFEDDIETDRLPAFTTLGAYVRLPVTETLALVLRGENLTDDTIVTRNSGGSIDLGVPRTVWAGVDIRL
ncbi:TonB-dependent receptor [Erythrobacter litoralis]|uniref:TonB-dependent receptor plug domain-containing protein n=1 Tax=Erythrobacter litoralis TaxID=39960 RepID=UPI00243519D6|nr:TonB-dependent receptor [Erythrobacter litoralis]MDG6080234.1 TonB-dependent receptor [Erythrobacter litoralis]